MRNNINMNSKYKPLIQDTLIFALGSIGSKVIVFFLVPFYTDFLTDAEYGISDLVFTVAQLLIPFVSLVIFDAVVRFGLYRKERPQDALLVGIIVWLIGTAVLILISPLLQFYKSIAKWSSYIVVFSSANILVSVVLNYLKTINRNLLYSVICIIQTAALAGINILTIAVWRMGIEGYLIAYVGSNIIAAVLAITFGRIFSELKKARFDKQLAKEMILYSSPLILNNISWWVIQSSDKMMIEAMVSAGALGIYTAAARIPSLISVFVSIFQQAWGISSAKEMDSSNDPSFYTNVFSAYSFAAFFAGIGLCTIIRPFMKIYIRNPAFSNAWQYVPLLLISAVFSAIAAYCGGMYGALKKSKNNMYSTASAALINILVNYIAINFCGLWGAIIGTVIAYVVLAFVRLIDIKRFVNIQINWRKIMLNAGIAITQALLVSFTETWTGIVCSMFAFMMFLIVNRDVIVFLLTAIKNRGK